jgi:hypothetical protein
MRGAAVPSGYQTLIELFARHVDGPIEQYRGFVDEYVVRPTTFCASSLMASRCIYQ